MTKIQDLDADKDEFEDDDDEEESKWNVFFGDGRVNFKSKILSFLVVEEISSENLMPGDIIEIKNQSMMQCDVVLLNGSVILNESILTGESLPITK